MFHDGMGMGCEQNKDSPKGSTTPLSVSNLNLAAYKRITQKQLKFN
jgi:hypothetical protein